MPPRNHKHETTIGIVTALDAEFKAMRALIDDRYEIKDKLTFCMGRIGPHRVVLIRLIEAGNGHAAGDCARLLERFPNLKLLLMVGTAAGADIDETGATIELGDVVVSTRGVVEHDHVNRYPEADRPRGALRVPSKLLRRHAEEVEDDPAHLRKWRRLITDVQHRYPGEFGRPTGNGTSSKVHLGRIASGNIAFNNRKAVAAVARDHEAIAIDMETFGVAQEATDGCGWMAVRGISDYGDEGRTKQWRNYASLAAAGYTRALLEGYPPYKRPRRVWPWVAAALAVGVAVGATFLTASILEEHGPVPLTDQVTVAGGTNMSSGQTAKLTISDQDSWRRSLDLTVALDNRSTVGDCVNPARLEVVLITDGHTRPELPLARSNEQVTVDIDGVQRTVLVEITVDMQDHACRVDLSVADAVLHD